MARYVAWHGLAWRGEAWHGKAWPGEARYEAWRGVAGQGEAWRGEAGYGARLGRARRGTAGRGEVRGEAWRGLARHGLARRGRVRGTPRSVVRQSLPKGDEMKRVVVLADLHCGHRVGLTPPAVDNGDVDDDHVYQYRRAIWNFYTKIVDSLKPIDIVIANGDLIEGKATKNGGVELIASDRTKQIRWATECLAYANPKQWFFTFGTGYHVGPEDDWETPIAEHFGGTIKSVQYIDVNGLVICARHHVGGSQSIPGRFTPLNNYRTWKLLWSFDGEFPRPDVSIVSHVHYFQVIQDRLGWAMSTPALQGYGSNFGARRMGGYVDVGLISFDVEDKNRWNFTPFLLKHTGALRSTAARTTATSTQLRSKKLANIFRQKE